MQFRAFLLPTYRRPFYVHRGLYVCHVMSSCACVAAGCIFARADRPVYSLRLATSRSSFKWLFLCSLDFKGHTTKNIKHQVDLVAKQNQKRYNLLTRIVSILHDMIIIFASLYLNVRDNLFLILICGFKQKTGERENMTLRENLCMTMQT